ncbi:short transient receptor potential channel 4-like isoform X2 [Ptychodera flava]|uniref:short transient receptor potential channel 4-like isoform X2 n=1 Tax=Ptychodera flava TaxID=63121 RepID=UPI00396A7D68
MEEQLICLEGAALLYEISQNNANEEDNQEAETFLTAVEESNYARVKSVLNAEPGKVDYVGKHRGKKVTPLQLAAERNDFYMVKLLFKHKAKPLNREKIGGDPKRSPLENSVRVYCTVSSPAYISISHLEERKTNIDYYGSVKDCVQQVFELVQEMTEFLHRESLNISKDENDAVAEAIERLKAFPIDLLNCCSTDDEVKRFLEGQFCESQLCSSICPDSKDDCVRYIIADKAIQTNQREFITQYRCQKFMKEEWLSGQPEWSRKKGFWWSLLYTIFAIFVYGILFQLLPVHLIVCKTYRLRHLIYSPKTAFLGHFLSYLFFLCVIFTYQVIVSYKIEGSHVVIESKGNHIPILVLCIIWFGLLFIEELIQVIIKGSTHYFKNMWNRLDLIILLSFFVGVVIGNPLIVTQPFDDPYISIYLSKFTSLTFIFALLRFMEPFYLSNFVGPILLIFTEMRHDIFRFLTIFIYVVTACAMAMYYVYVGVTVEENQSEFAHFPSSLSSLVITIFGGDASQSLIVDRPELSNFTSDAQSTGKEPAYTYFTLLGYILYIMFGTITLIMLLNLCIAMMSDRYTKLQAEIDLVWTFERSRIWMGYIGGDGPNLNAMSFVLVVSALSIGLFITSINKCYNLCHTKRRRRKVSHGISKEAELQEVRTGKDSSKKTKTNEDEQMGTTTAAEGSEKTDKNETKLEKKQGQ